MSQIVIQSENLGKQYRLGQVGTGTLSHDLNRWWARIRGKEDPFAKIGTPNYPTNNVGAEYIWALKDINFTIHRGDAVGIIGRNGAGKSTLLKLLSKVTAPTAGCIRLNGRVASLLEVGTGFHPEMTGRENIYMNGAIMGMTRKEIHRKFDEIVDFSGVELYIDTPVKRYSSGMYIRLAFAVAAHLDTEILIVDEVLAVGDASFQKKCIGKMNEISQGKGRTILFVSHNMAAIQNLCTTGIVLNSGCVSHSGTISECITHYTKSRSSNITERRLTGKKLYNQYKSRITSVKLLNLHGQPQSVFAMGENFKIGIGLDMPEQLKDIHVNVRLNDESGVGIAAWRSKEMGVKIPYSRHLYIELEIQDLNVFDSFYSFAVSLNDSLETIDLLDHAIDIEIVPAPLEIFNGIVQKKSFNVIYTPAKWNVRASVT